MLNQIMASRDTELVVAMHGAGLGNVLFSSESTLIELHPYAHSKETYSSLAYYAGIDYFAWYNQDANSTIDNDTSNHYKPSVDSKGAKVGNAHLYWKHKDQTIQLSDFETTTWNRFEAHRIHQHGCLCTNT
ncbi:hypothetical protein SARC_06663 [Sphaeroforma arctica JP610]|uniref:Uncharacterized protein n=1 Tax=Sphaeroforma arctica JP610 TaxID=667725 RepID=A0A0L0FWG9_9EUKA|nr:hypothetical protein SARC_06663 [Sphaeroforma arctica JP610]KNC80989.1 hypothetical protein SARC_06663 [Sphaeroforma arctica JP610]|eukprot:XP_014154891.1 hypothetical protein SARC_06663 [Sphaeroforma arctica JP610]